MELYNDDQIADLRKFLKSQGKKLLETKGEWEVFRWEADNPGVDHMPIIYVNKHGMFTPNPQAKEAFMDWCCWESENELFN